MKKHENASHVDVYSSVRPSVATQLLSPAMLKQFLLNVFFHVLKSPISLSVFLNNLIDFILKRDFAGVSKFQRMT